MVRLSIFLVVALFAPLTLPAAVRAGAAKVDVSPRSFPVIVNCGFLEKTARELRHPLFARAVVLDDGATRLALATVDSCMMPRELIDRAKALASKQTGIREDRMMVSATHTHSAPAAMACLGSRAESAYAEALPGLIAEAIANAASKLAPARAGWAAFDDWEHTHTRRWILRPDKMKADPFGNVTVRANMHPGYENPEAIVESGPVDPQFSLLAFQGTDGKPIAILANYSQHYFGASPVSGDYQAMLAQMLSERTNTPVVLFSQGTSGDQMWMDYGRPKPADTLESYSAELAARAVPAFERITYSEDVTVAMAESRIRLRRRTPDAARLEWSRGVLAAMKTPGPTSQPEVYAREARHIHEEPERELKLQAIRVGDTAITAIPDEVFAITGLKIKARSPLAATFNIELANGAEGYIPPPEQHLFGGYTTWPARSAGLEVSAEPRIVAEVTRLLEQVSSAPRRHEREPVTAYSKAVRDSKPDAYARMDEMEGGPYTGRVAYHLPGIEGRASHAVYFAGGHRRLKVPPGPAWTVEAWIWPGVEHTSLFGVAVDAVRRHWLHAVLIREGGRLRLEIDGVEQKGTPKWSGKLGEGFEGKIDETAVYRRVLSPVEIAAHRAAAGFR
ncbi:MAG: hypothetical protein R2729_17950 [Bryobacteraceae bacterium]